MRENSNVIDPKYYELHVAIHEGELEKLKQIMLATGSDAEEVIGAALNSYWTYLAREGLIVDENKWK